MSLLQYYSVLKARRKTLAFVVATVVAVVMTISLLQPKSYTATTSLLVDVKSADPVAGVALSALPPEVLLGYLTTQAEVISSERTASKVISKLQLDKNEAYRTMWSSGPSEKISFDSWLTDVLRKKLDIKPSRDSNVITIGFSDANSKMAAEVANAFAQAYLEIDIDLKVEPARKAASWFDERTKEVRNKLDKAQAKLSEYQRQKGIVIAPDDKLDVENTRMDELGKELTALQSASAEAQSKQRQGGALPEVIQSPTVLALRGDLARQVAKLREMGAQLGANHPQYQRLEAEVRALRERVTIESAQVAGSIGATARVNQQREAQIRTAYEAQKNKVLAMKTVRDEASLLLRDVESAKREYDVVLQRLAQTTLESRSTQTNVTVLNRATAPLFPSSPKLKLNLLLSIFAGTLLGVVISFVLEGIDRRIHDANDLAEALHLPVLAVLEPATAIARLPLGNDVPRLPRSSSAAAN